jgi:peptidoglycan/xylan/chitin deacetylase (PgdA/CDA1 family)
MYHDVAVAVPKAGGGPERFSVSAETFEAMLDVITGAGYVGCSLGHALTLTRRPRVAITFDDGTAGQFAHAVPALRDRGMTATFFVTTDWVGRPGFMDWDQIRQLAAWGMSVQSHSKSHPFLSELGGDSLRFELAESKAVLDDELRQVTTQIALPGGDAPRRRLRHVLADTGYRIVATSRWGRNADSEDGANADRIWIRRCTAPRSAAPELARRIISGDQRIGAARYSREALLNGLRAVLGASRYSRWRRRALNALARRTA